MRTRATVVAVSYAVIAGLWIAFSDGALLLLGLSAERISAYSFIKGMAFIGVTSLALFFLVERFARADAMQQEQYRELFEQHPNAMWYYDLETLAFLRVNDAAVRKYGYSREEFLAMTIADIRPPEDLDRLMGNIETARMGAAGTVDEAGVWRHRTKDGRLLWVDITSHIAEIAGRRAEVVLVRDVTEAYEAQQELLRYKLDLERLVSERTAQLERANAELKAATEAKSAFLATMSHELRTPLNSIIGFSGIIAEGMAGPINAEQAKQLAFVRTSAKHLHALIDDVLDLSRIESGRVEIMPESVSVGEIVESVEGSGATLAAEKGLDWVVSPFNDLRFTTDPRKVMQILLNLIANAVKYTETGTVRLDIASGAGKVRFSVSDTGPGIPEAEQHRIFEEFVRIDVSGALSEGSGLGLAIAARLARLLGGMLELSRTSQAGSTFTVTLPIEQAD